MKRILLAMTMAMLAFGAAPRAHADTDVSINFFYDNLDDGDWMEVGDYGYCWQPNVAASDRSWRPYADGYWAYTDVGWTWVSYENFGWATYHYGRWARLRDRGWVWVPGTEWGPAWVSWRTGGDHIGWAPLPPRREGGEPIYEGRPISGRVDIDFDIGPEYYNFVDVRYIGEPVLRRRIVDTRENVTYVNTTVNVTNITYQNSTVYNYGPDYSRVSAYSTREIPRLQLQRETNVDLRTAARDKSVTKVQGNQLLIAAPMKFERPAQAVAPKVVKAKVEKANIETGWGGMNDPKKKAELQAKFKSEDAKTIPPPKVQPVHPEELKNVGASPAAGASPVASAAPMASATPATPATSATPSASKREDDLTMPTPTPPPNQNKGRGREQRGHGAQSLPTASAAPGAEATATPAMTPNEKKSNGRDRRGLRGQPTPAASAAPSVGESAAPTTTPNERKGNNRNKVLGQTPSPSDAAAGAPNDPRKERRNLRPERNTDAPSVSEDSTVPRSNKMKSLQSDPANSNADPSQVKPEMKGRGNKPQVQQQVQPSQNVPNEQQQGGGRGNKGEKEKKNKQGEPAATPAPNQ